MAHDTVPAWDRPEPPRQPRTVALTREAIVQCAVRAADSDGLEAVTLRRVAGDLGTGPMRLYRFVSDKSELLDLMAEEVYGEIAAQQTRRRRGAWRASLVEYADAVRSAVTRHPWFAEVASGRPLVGPNALACREAPLAALHGQNGLASIESAAHAVGAVHSYLMGAVRGDLAEERATRTSGMDERSWQRSVGPRLSEMLASGDYPALDAFVREAGPPDRDAEFAAGLALVLDGISARIARA